MEKENLQIKNDEIIEEMMEKDVIEQIEKVKTAIGSLQKNFEEDVEYIHANDDSKALKSKAATIEKDITSANF